MWKWQRKDTFEAPIFYFVQLFNFVHYVHFYVARHWLKISILFATIIIFGKLLLSSRPPLKTARAEVQVRIWCLLRHKLYNRIMKEEKGGEGVSCLGFRTTCANLVIYILNILGNIKEKKCLITGYVWCVIKFWDKRAFRLQRNMSLCCES